MATVAKIAVFDRVPDLTPAELDVKAAVAEALEHAKKLNEVKQLPPAPKPK